MKIVDIYMKSGNKITVKCNEMKCTKDNGKLDTLTWINADKYPSLFTIDVDQIEAIVMIKES